MDHLKNLTRQPGFCVSFLCSYFPCFSLFFSLSTCLPVNFTMKFPMFFLLVSHLFSHFIYKVPFHSYLLADTEMCCFAISTKLCLLPLTGFYLHSLSTLIQFFSGYVTIKLNHRNNVFHGGSPVLHCLMLISFYHRHCMHQK